MLATLCDSEVESRHDSACDPNMALWAPRYVTSVTPHILFIRVAVQLQGYSTINRHLMKLNEWQKHVSVS